MRIALTASNSPLAQDALSQLKALYGNIITPPEQAEVIVALGGDGFMLETLHRFTNLDTPVYGMNRGTIGFLMNHFEPSHMLERIAQAQPHSLAPLRVIAKNHHGKIFEASAINEVSLLRQGPQAAHLRILVQDRERLDCLVSDGLMVSTPAGSTAYNLSAGGPILPMDANVLAMTPLAAFRPRRWHGALLPQDALISIEILDPEKRPVMVSADSTGFENATTVEICRETRFAHNILFDPGHGLEDRILNEQFC